VIRKCNGTDPALTRLVTVRDFDPMMMGLAPDQDDARPGYVVVLCQCGAEVNDITQILTYPHDYLGQQPLPLPGL
jgi:hypothetical protein